jgi:hypothetical protein
MEQAKEEGWWEDSGRDGNHMDWLLIGESSEREAGYDIRQGTGAVAFIAASNNRNSHNGSNGDYLALARGKANFQDMAPSILTAQASGQIVLLFIYRMLRWLPP